MNNMHESVHDELDKSSQAVIETGTVADIDGCARIMASLPESFTGTALQDFRRDVIESHLLICRQDSIPVGFVTWIPRAAKEAEITWLAVSPEIQSRGIGSQLLAHAELQATEAGIQILEVKTLAEGPDSPEYERTRHFYERHGFVLSEVIDPYPGWEPGNPCAVYRKPLSSLA